VIRIFFVICAESILAEENERLPLKAISRKAGGDRYWLYPGIHGGDEEPDFGASYVPTHAMKPHGWGTRTGVQLPSIGARRVLWAAIFAERTSIVMSKSGTWQ
jgi:hypothetical protein